MSQAVRKFFRLGVSSFICLLVVACGSEGETNAQENNAPQENRAPTIFGIAPDEVYATEAYEFTPSAADADGDSLTFQIQNRPPWIDFNTTTGTLSGQPEVADIGIYGAITISVSDGSASTSLPPFHIEVTEQLTYTVSVAWESPTHRQDGTPLDNLAGHRIYYGRAGTATVTEIDIPDPGQTSITVEKLVEGSWYFFAIAVDTYGQLSVPSDSFNIDLP